MSPVHYFQAKQSLQLEEYFNQHELLPENIVVHECDKKCYKFYKKHRVTKLIDQHGNYTGDISEFYGDAEKEKRRKKSKKSNRSKPEDSVADPMPHKPEDSVADPMPHIPEDSVADPVPHKLDGPQAANSPDPGEQAISKKMATLVLVTELFNCLV